MLVVHAHQVLGLGDFGYAVVPACQAVGAVGAGQVAPVLARRIGGEWTLVCVPVVAAVGYGVIWQSRSAHAVGIALALTVCAGVTWDVVVVSPRQTLIPKPSQSRVNSVYRLIGWGPCRWAPGWPGSPPQRSVLRRCSRSVPRSWRSPSPGWYWASGTRGSPRREFEGRERDRRDRPFRERYGNDN
ncbi:hypothetical protein ACWGCW_06330 [Streptomyces sp. NPDC054933]